MVPLAICAMTVCAGDGRQLTTLRRHPVLRSCRSEAAGRTPSHSLRPLQAKAIIYRIAFGPPRQALTVGGVMQHETTAHQALCADINAFSLLAAVRVEAHDRKRLEDLRRYISRPPLSDERVQLKAAGQVEVELKAPWSDRNHMPARLRILRIS